MSCHDNLVFVGLGSLGAYNVNVFWEYSTYDNGKCVETLFVTGDRGDELEMMTKSTEVLVFNTKFLHVFTSSTHFEEESMFFGTNRHRYSKNSLSQNDP
jgi:hypothetical protein